MKEINDIISKIIENKNIQLLDKICNDTEFYNKNFKIDIVEFKNKYLKQNYYTLIETKRDKIYNIKVGEIINNAVNSSK